jgi:hypothetical protein
MDSEVAYECVSWAGVPSQDECRAILLVHSPHRGVFLNRRSFILSGISFLISFLGLSAGGIWAFLKQAKFGGTPADARLDRIVRSPNFRDGKFQNQLVTPMMTGESGSLNTMVKFVFNRNKRLRPKGPIPSLRRDLRDLAPTENVLVWFGHSSYFLQLDGKRILVDPVLSGRASPVSFTTKAFDGTDPYTVADLPDIDILFLTHDHWDHLDYETVTQLRPRVKRVICGLGVGAHLERWGYASKLIDEGDWGDKFDLGDGFWCTFYRRDTSQEEEFVATRRCGSRMLCRQRAVRRSTWAEIAGMGRTSRRLESSSADSIWRFSKMANTTRHGSTST